MRISAPGYDHGVRYRHPSSHSGEVGLQRILQLQGGSRSFGRSPELLELCTVLKAPWLLLWYCRCMLCQLNQVDRSVLLSLITSHQDCHFSSIRSGKIRCLTRTGLFQR